jgi:osmotically inducible protein OsmC
MAIRSARAKWNGGLKDGDGTMALGSGAFEGAYSFSTRFEEGTGTNPEELIGAALAACFSMALSASLEREGHTPESVETVAKVHLRGGDGGPSIAQIELQTTGRVPGIDQAKFAEAAEDTKTNCIVSRALAGVEDMSAEATLES